MQFTANSSAAGIPRFAVVSLVVVASVMVAGLAFSIAFDRAIVGLGICVVAALPILAYVAMRWPMIFPFGLYALSVPFDPLLKVAGGTGATVTKLLGVVTIAALLLHAFRLRRLNAPPLPWFVWGGYLFLCLIGLAWSIDTESTLNVLYIMGALFALYTAAAIYPITSAAYVIARRATVFAGATTALYGFYAYAAGQRLNGTRLSLSSGAMHYDPNHYAAFFSIPIGILAARLFITRSGLERAGASLMLLAMFVNVLLSGSRGGLIAVTILLVYVGVRARAYVSLGVMFLGGLALTFLIPNVWTRILDPSQGDASGRGEIWNVGFSAIHEYGLLGSGFGTFTTAYNENLNHAVQRVFAGFNRPAHNILIQTTTEVGVLGLVILLGAWWTTFRENASIPRRSVYFADRIGYEGALLGIFISALTIDLLWFKYLWLCLMLTAMLTNVVRPTLLFGRRSAASPRTAMREVAARVPGRL